MYTPDPRVSLGEKGRNGESWFYRKFGDYGEAAKLPEDVILSYNPTSMVTYSRGQLAQYNGVRPARNEQKLATGYGEEPGIGEFTCGLPYPIRGRYLHTDGEEFLGKMGFYTIKPKTPAEAAQAGVAPWSINKLRDVILKQDENFPNHESGQKDSKWALLDQEMQKACHMKQCKPLDHTKVFHM